MIEERYIELMNREIDRANSEIETAELGRYLESSEEARMYYDQLRDLAAAFERAGEITPPTGLDQIILSSIADREARRAASRERFSIRAFLHPKSKLAYAFAAGVVLGLIIMAIIFRWPAGTPSPGVADLYGALAGRSAGALFSVESTRIDEPGLSGTVEVRYLEHAIQVALALTAENETEIDLAPAGGLLLIAFRAQQASRPYGLGASAEHIEITFTGRCDDALLFADERGSHAPVALRVSSAGKVILEKMIEPEKRLPR